MIYLLRIVKYVIIAHFCEKNNPSYEKGLILQGKFSAKNEKTGEFSGDFDGERAETCNSPAAPT